MMGFQALAPGASICSTSPPLADPPKLPMVGRLPSNFRRNAMVEPEQGRIERDHRGHLFQGLVTERVCTRNDAATRGIGEAEPATTELAVRTRLYARRDVLACYG